MVVISRALKRTPLLGALVGIYAFDIPRSWETAASHVEHVVTIIDIDLWERRMANARHRVHCLKIRERDHDHDLKQENTNV